MPMSESSIENQVQAEHGVEISDLALERLRAKFDDAISYETASERATALEAVIADCAAPLEALEVGAELSPEYSAFLESLTKMHMLEQAHAKLEGLLK